MSLTPDQIVALTAHLRALSSMAAERMSDFARINALVNASCRAADALDTLAAELKAAEEARDAMRNGWRHDLDEKNRLLEVEFDLKSKLVTQAFSLDAATARAEAAEAERDAALKTLGQIIDDTAAELDCKPDNEEILFAIDRLKKERDAALKRAARLEEALRPFANSASRYHAWALECLDLQHAHFSAARAALEDKPND